LPVFGSNLEYQQKNASCWVENVLGKFGSAFVAIRQERAPSSKERVPSVSPALLIKLVIFVDIQDLAIWFAGGRYLRFEHAREGRHRHIAILIHATRLS